MQEEETLDWSRFANSPAPSTWPIVPSRAYAYLIERCIRFPGVWHPNTIVTAEVEEFLTLLAVE